MITLACAPIGAIGHTPHHGISLQRPPRLAHPQVLVGEPSVADTINILRGLKEKYESHHGVRVTDRALVVAAELSDRYIQSRFLPDKVRHGTAALAGQNMAGLALREAGGEEGGGGVAYARW